MDPSKKKEKPIKRSISKLFRDRAHSFAASGLPPAPSSPDGSFGRKASVGGHRSKSRASESFGSASSSSGVPLTPEDALIEAIRRGDVAQVKALLSQSVNVSHEDATGRQPLHFAVRRGNVSMITSLIQAGASVNAQTMVKMNDSLTKYKTKDQTPLHIACDTGNSEVVKLLLQHGADPTINDSTHCLPEQIATIKGNSLAAITVLSHRHLAKGTKRLELKRMSITNFDLGPLSLLAQLTMLDLSSNNLTRFPVKDLAALPLLTVLDLSNNSIYEVPETVSRLQGLTKLKLANNQLRFPPFELLHLTNAKKITLKGNPFIRFPKPIYTGETSELMRFLQNLENENEQYSKVKLMFLGDERCGKTSLLHQLRAGQPSDSQSIFQAQSVDVSKLPGLDDRVEFLAYDFPPDEINFPTHQFFFTARAIYVICIPADRPLKQVRLDYWIKLIQSASKGSKASIFLAVTKIDESSDEARLKQLVDELTSYKSRISENIEICLVNNMTGQGVMDLHQLITNAAIENPLFKKTYPPSWKTLVRRLSRVSKEGSQVLSRQQYLELSLDINVQGDNLLNALVSLQDAGLLTFLHDRDPSNRSGASLISPLPDYIVLDQTWLAKFFDNLVLHRRRIIVNGLISLSDINESWGHAKPHQRHIILEWMCSKEIAYRFRSNCILVPSLLRDRKPSLSSQLWTPNILPGFVEYRRVYSISVNTTNLFSRQLARLFHIPHSEVVFIWKTGLILSHPTNFQSNATDSLMGSTSSSLHPDRNQSEVTYTETSENDDLSISTTTDGSGDGSDNEEVDDFRSGSITPKNGSSSSSLALGAFLQASSSNLTQSCGAPSSNGSWNSASSPSSSSSSFASFSTSSSSSNDNSMKPNTMYALVQHNPLTNETTVNVRVPEDVLPWLLPSIIMHLDEQLWSFHLKQSEHQVLVPCSHCILKNPLAQPYQFTLEDCVEAITSGSFYIYCNRIQSYSRRVRVDSLAPDLALFCAQFLRGITCDRILSEGGFGLVFQGTYCGNQVAVKEMRIKPWGEGSSYNLSKFSAFQREVSILAIANHPNLIQLYGISFNPLRMVMEFLPDGDLYHLLNSSDSISLTYRLRICLDIAKGLRYLHKLTPPIVHRDIRSPNILIASRDENATIVAKVADFGLARQVAPTLNGSVGNWQWMAPEVIASDSSGYDERSDIYSFGVVMWEIFSRCAPFLEYESQERFMRSLGVDDKGEAIFAVRYQSIKQAVIEEELRPTIPDDTPLPVAEIIQKCWRHSPSDRPSFEAIVSSLSALLGRSYSEEQSPSPSFFPQPSTFVPSLQLPKSEDGTDSSEAPVPDASNGRQLIQILDQELPPPKIKIFHSNVRTLPIGDKALCSVYIRPNFWVGGSKGTLWLVDTKSLDVRRLDSTHTTRVYAITKVNKEAWVSSEIGKIFIYDTETFAGLGEIDAHQENMIRDLATYEDANGQTMVCSCSPIDQSIKIWCGDTRKLVKSISFNDFAISSIHLDGDSIWLGSQKDLVLFELSKLTTEKKCEPVVFLTGHSKKINIITTFPDTIWSGSDDNSICIWSKRKNEMIRKITAHTRPVKCLVKINQFVASGSPDCTIIVWDSENGLPVAELELEGEVLSISQAKRMLCVGVSRSIVLVPFKLL